MLDQNVHSGTYWNQRYRSAGDQYVFGTAPDDLARMLYGFFLDLELSTNVPLLDLGCGEGRDAVYFSRRGFHVTAVDASQEGIAKGVALARDQNADVRFLTQNVGEFQFEGTWPVIYANNVLQFLGDDACDVHRNIQVSTEDSGWNAISWFLDTELPPDQFSELRILASNELREWYTGWRVFYYGENVLYRPSGDHYLSFAKIIARKPPC